MKKPKIKQKRSTNTKKVFLLIFAALAIIMLVLPFFVTFNEFLTRIIIKIGIYNEIQGFIVPYEAKMIAATVSLFGIKSWSQLGNIYMMKGGEAATFYLSWNCIGWQSLILILITFIVGLSGNYTIGSKIETLVIGILGTFLMNIIRITIVFIFAYYVGGLTAIIFHDYGSTLMIIAWLFFFWWFSYRYIMQPLPKDKIPPPKPIRRMVDGIK